jgi:hypothetical protein
MTIDFQNAAAKLKALAEAEAMQRHSLSEYSERTDTTKIPLLAIDVEQHELEGRELSGIWCLNHGPLDQFSSEFMELAGNLGIGLPGKPRSIDPLTFLLHNLSLFLWRTEDRQKAGFRYLNLLTKPLPNGRSIKIRQIVSLIKATELYVRQTAILATTSPRPFKPQESTAPPWHLVEDINLGLGDQDYPKWVYQPDGRHRIVSTRDEHAGLFTTDWITRGIVTMPVNADETETDGSALLEFTSGPLPRRAPLDPLRAPNDTASPETAVQDDVVTVPDENSKAARAAARQAVVGPILKLKRWKRGKWATEAGVSKNSVYEYVDGTRTLSDQNRKAMAEVLGLKPEELPD